MTNCPFCNSPSHRKLQKLSAQREIYTLLECKNCGLWHIEPIPSEKQLNVLYQSAYFEKRTDRGYDNYASEKIKKSYLSTLEKNLVKLSFFEFESALRGKKTALEVGCAAGYFVEFLKLRGWNSQGIDIAGPMIQIARNNGLDVVEGNFLETGFPESSYDLVTLWATIEHLREPWKFMEKISAILKPGARFYVSTCHNGFFGKIYGANWRYLNVPEHIWYFSKKSLANLGNQYGLSLRHSFTYGSGFTSRTNAGMVYNFCKKLADKLALHFHTGDMIVCEFIKESVE